MKLEIEINDEIVKSLDVCQKHMNLSFPQLINLAIVSFLMNIKKEMDFENARKINKSDERH